MKSRYSAYLLLSFLPLFSCSKQTIHPGARFELLSEVVAQDAPIEFRFNLDDADKQYYNNQPLFAEILCSSSNDAERESVTVVRLSHELEGQIIVPDNAAAVVIHLSAKEKILDKYSSGTIAVRNKNLQVARKARTYLLLDSVCRRPSEEEANEREFVDSLFNAERASYPDDLAIFACRWMYELKTGSLDTARIRKDLSIISDFRGRAIRDAMLYMGSFLRMLAIKHLEAVSCRENDTRKGYMTRYAEAEMEQLSRQYPIPDTIFGRTNNPIFNDPNFVNWLFIVRGLPYLFSSEWTDEIQKIIHANPLSRYSEMCFISGTDKFISPEIALYAVEEMMKRAQYPLYKYYKMKILSKSYPHRRAECFSLIKELKAIVHKDTYYEEGVDPWHYFYTHRIEPYLVEGDLLAQSGMYDSAIATVRESQGVINDPWDYHHAMVFSQCSEYFMKKGCIDSSTKYMLATVRFAPGKKYFVDTLRARYGRAKSKLDYSSWIRTIEKTLPADTYAPVPNSISRVSLANGSTLDFNKLGDTIVVIECWAAGCSLCTQNIKYADDFLKQNHSRKIKIFIASRTIQELDERMKSLHIDLPVIKDGGDIVRTFRIHSYPETIVIQGGRIIGRYSGLLNIEDIVNLVQ